jgi:SAM-dependent methyltransferase
MMVPKARILKEDVSKTSLSNESCDFCLSTMVIEHVDDNEFLKEVYRILRPRGWFLITTVLRRKNAWYFYKNIEGETVLESSHLREYTSVSNFLSLLKTNGFVVVKIKTPRIKFPLIDPFLKILVRFFKNDFLRRLPTTKPVETFRKITRIPIPGYYAIEVVAQKRDYKKNKFGL